MSESEDLLKAREKKEKLERSKFKQQTLAAWRPVPTLKSSLITFLIFGVIFLTLGIILIEFSKNIKEHIIEYQETWSGQTTCTIPFTTTEDMDQPVYVYYQLNNFYQNHRRYVKSRSFDQLRGEIKSVGDLGDCDPIKTNADLGRTHSWGNTLLDQSAAANPCGLVAKSFFNDTYALSKSDTTAIDIDETNIAWESDKEEKFKLAPNSANIQWIKPTDEHFIVWMRTAGMPNFRKLWGKVTVDMPKGDYVLTITNNYDVSAFDGKKKFVLSTTNAFGGKNFFLAIWYLVVGSLCLIFALIFLIAHLRKQKRKKEE